MSHPDVLHDQENCYPEDECSQEYPYGDTIEPYDIHKDQMEFVFDSLFNQLKEN